MAMNQAIEIRPDRALQMITPQDVVAAATEQATVLMEVVDNKGLFTMISGKKFLLAEAWEIIAAFNRCSLVTEWTRPITMDGTEVGVEARVNIISDDTGQVVGAGEMVCGYEEFPCRGKEGMAKRRAASSSAQTWAASKACRLKWARIAVMAGYAPTPAEEMVGSTVAAAAPADKSQHWCSAHQTEFFKKGRMLTYAHKIDGSDSWHNEPDANAPTPPQEPVVAKGDPLAAEYAALAAQLGWDGEDTGLFVQREFGGSWKTITLEQRQEAVDALKLMLDHQQEQPPVQEEELFDLHQEPLDSNPIRI